MRVRRPRAQRRGAGVPAEVVQLVAHVGHVEPADQLAVGRRALLDVEHGQRVRRAVAVRAGVERRDVRVRLGRRRGGGARGGIEARVRSPARHVRTSWDGAATIPRKADRDRPRLSRMASGRARQAGGDMPAAFSFDETHRGDVAELALAGDLDMQATFRLEPDARAAWLDAGDVREVVLDLSDVSFVDSSGLGLLLGAYDRCVESETAMEIVPASARGPARVRAGRRAGLAAVQEPDERVGRCSPPREAPAGRPLRAAATPERSCSASTLPITWPTTRAVGGDEERLRQAGHAPLARGLVGGVAHVREREPELGDEVARVSRTRPARRAPRTARRASRAFHPRSSTLRLGAARVAPRGPEVEHHRRAAQLASARPRRRPPPRSNAAAAAPAGRPCASVDELEAGRRRPPRRARARRRSCGRPSGW